MTYEKYKSRIRILSIQIIFSLRKILSLAIFAIFSCGLFAQPAVRVSFPDEGLKPATGVPPSRTLEDTVRLALSKNRLLQSFRFGHEAAEYDIKRARSDLMPKVNFSQGWNRIDPQTFDNANVARDFMEQFFGLEPGTIPPFLFRDTWATHFTLTQSIYNGGSIWTGYRQAEIKAEMEHYQVRDFELEVIFQTKEKFYSLLKAGEIYGVREEAERLAEENLRDVRIKKEQGLRSLSDVLRWEVQLASEKAERVTAENNLRLARYRLEELVGLELRGSFTAEAIPEASVLSMEESFQHHFLQEDAAGTPFQETHPAAAAAVAATRMAGKSIDLAKSRFKPSVNFTADYGWRENDTFSLDDYSTWFVALQVEFPLFNSFGDYYNLQRARKDRRRAEREEDHTRRALTTGRAETLLAVRAALARMEITGTAVRQAEENFRIMKDKYEVGLATNIELIDAQVVARRARVERISALYAIVDDLKYLFFRKYYEVRDYTDLAGV